MLVLRTKGCAFLQIEMRQTEICCRFARCSRSSDQSWIASYSVTNIQVPFIVRRPCVHCAGRPRSDTCSGHAGESRGCGFVKYATKDEGDVAIQSLHNVRTMAPSAALMQVCNFSIAAYVTSCASGLSLSGAFLSFFGK